MADSTHTHEVYDEGPTASANQWPPYIEVVLAKASVDTSLPSGMYGLFNGTPPGDWDSQSDSGENFYQKLLFADSSTSFPTTAGQETHTHSNYTFATDGTAVGTVQADANPSNAAGNTPTHIHNITVSFDTGSNWPPYRDAIIAKYSPVPLAPSITSVTDSPDPVSAGADVTFSVDWDDTGSVKAKICKTDSLTNQNCDGGFWASTSPDFVSSDPVNETYTTTADDFGINNYYAYVCNTAAMCSSFMAGTFGVGDDVRIKGDVRIRGGVRIKRN